MIIDFHTHAFPKELATYALDKLSPKCGNVTPSHNGDLKSLIEKMRRDGCDKSVVLNIATNPEQQTDVNDFAISQLKYPELIPFGSVHPDSENVFGELERLKKAGIKGVKLHPDYQDFFVDDEKMFPIYEKISGLGMITVFHAGVDIGKPTPIHCTPARLLKALPYFNGATVVAAHMGGFLLWRDVIDTLCGSDVYIDTSFSYGKLPPIWAKEMIAKHGADRFLFGTDAPWSSVEDELKFINSLDLSCQDKEKILHLNAEKILNI